MTDTEILKLCDWCDNHCGKGQKHPDIECLRKYYSELAKPIEERK